MFDPLPASLPARAGRQGTPSPDTSRHKAEGPLETGYKGDKSNVRLIGINGRMGVR